MAPTIAATTARLEFFAATDRDTTNLRFSESVVVGIDLGSSLEPYLGLAVRVPSLAATLVACVACGGRLIGDLNPPGDDPHGHSPMVDPSDAGEAQASTPGLVFDATLPSPDGEDGIRLVIEGGGDADLGDVDRGEPVDGPFDEIPEADPSAIPEGDPTTCPMGCAGTCTAGRCVVTLATGQQSPYALAVDGQDLYWTNYSGGTVMMLPLAGGTPTPVVTGQTHPKFIALDRTNVYWTDDTTVMSVPLGGGSPTVLASGQIEATGIAVDAVNVYWTNNGGGSVRKVPLTGGSPGTLAQGQTAPYAIAVNSSVAVWTNYSSFGSVVMVGLDGGPPVTLPSTNNSPENYNPLGVAIDDVNVYWTHYSAFGPVYEQPVAGGSPVMLTTENGPYGIAIDNASVYFTAPNGGPHSFGAVEKVPIDGGTTVMLASCSEGQYPQAIAVDATSVYFANYGDGSIVKVTPK